MTDSKPAPVTAYRCNITREKIAELGLKQPGKSIEVRTVFADSLELTLAVLVRRCVRQRCSADVRRGGYPMEGVSQRALSLVPNAG